MDDKPTITILMAVYNGEKYIKKQLDSLLNQTYENWKLIVRDDGSEDNSVKIIQSYASRFQNISLVINITGNKGPCSNFSALFDLAVNDKSVNYIMFCDQDDVWKPEKIERSVSVIIGQEQQFKNQPVLVYSDLELTDDNDNRIKGSLKLKHKIELRTLMSFNYVYGCTMIMNRQLMDKIGHIPAAAVNHDYWVALVASIYKSHFIDDKLIRYRQHNSNVSGNIAGNNRWSSRIKRQFIAPQKEINKFRSILQTLKLFYNNYKNELSISSKNMMLRYLNSFHHNRFYVCYVIISNKIFRRGFIQSLAAFYQVLFFYHWIKPSSPVNRAEGLNINESVISSFNANNL
jgi:rhamnosyltransferase